MVRTWMVAVAALTVAIGPAANADSKGATPDDARGRHVEEIVDDQGYVRTLTRRSVDGLIDDVRAARGRAEERLDALTRAAEAGSWSPLEVIFVAIAPGGLVYAGSKLSVVNAREHALAATAADLAAMEHDLAALENADAVEPGEWWVGEEKRSRLDVAEVTAAIALAPGS